MQNITCLVIAVILSVPICGVSLSGCKKKEEERGASSPALESAERLLKSFDEIEGALEEPVPLRAPKSSESKNPGKKEGK